MINGLITLIAFAQEAGNAAMAGGASEAAAGAKPQAQNSGMMSLIMIIAMIAIFYFLMIRPQQKKQKEIRQKREALREGDRVVTAGGIYGKIKAVKESTFTVQIANDVIIKVDRNSVYPDSTSSEDIVVAENK